MFPILVHSIHPKGFLIFPPTSPTYVKSGSPSSSSPSSGAPSFQCMWVV